MSVVVSGEPLAALVVPHSPAHRTYRELQNSGSIRQDPEDASTTPPKINIFSI